jgi:hypothetical protein
MAFELNQTKLYLLTNARSTFHSVFVLMHNSPIRIKIPPFDTALEIVLITNVKCITAKQLYRVYKKKRNLGISQEIDIVLKTKDFRRLGI